MKYILLGLLIIIVPYGKTLAQTDLIFKSTFGFVPTYNDTGITWAGEYPTGNNIDCSSNTVSEPQDCNNGRDATHNLDFDGHAGFSFTKLDENGNSLPSSALSWTCVKDNVTQLFWEVKTTTSDIHNKNYVYQWGGISAQGRDHPNRKGEYFEPSWNELVLGSNDNNFCGFTNWRVPTINELSGLTNLNGSNPAIDTIYFPNTRSYWFWSSTPVSGVDESAFLEGFIKGDSSFTSRASNFHVRLVRSNED